MITVRQGQSAPAEASKKGRAKPAKKPTKKGAKKSARKATPTRRKKGKSTGEPGTKDVVLALDDLVEVDELVADARPKVVPKKSRTPQTPTAPRSVKPPPKGTNLEMSAEILEFVDAIDAYRQENCRPFPTWTEVFSILKRLGYSKS